MSTSFKKPMLNKLTEAYCYVSLSPITLWIKETVTYGDSEPFSEGH